MIPIFKPSYGKEELKAVKEVLLSGWVGLGPRTAEFEKKFASYIGTKYAVGVNSCTAALHLALKVLEVENREVITTPLTFVATNHAILYNQGIPVFTDILPDTLNIDPDQIKKNITRKTKVVMVVHYAGHPCRMDDVLPLVKKRGLYLVEDAAHACGAEYKGRKAGSFGKMGCFSLHAVKNLATGDGGMITTDDKKVYQRLLRLRWCGISKSTWQRDKRKQYKWLYSVEELGFKCHMNDITAALGLVQLKRLESLNRRRREIVRRYNRGLSGLRWLEIPVVKPHIRSAHHAYVIKTDFRNKLNEYLARKGISTGVHYYPNNLYKMYKKFRGDTPVAFKLWKRLLTLPLYPDLKNSQVDSIIGEIGTFGRKVLKEE